MSVRSTAVQLVTVNGAGAPLANQQVQATLIVPGTASPVDLNGERIDLTPLSATSDNTGTATFDPAASPTNGLIAPQDVQQYVSGVLVPLPGCYWQLSYSSTQIFSPNYAYTASIINAATWTSIPSTLGLIKCYLTDVYGSGLAIANRTFSVALSGDAFWTGGAGLGQRIPGNAGFPVVSNGSGTLTAYVIRQSELNPSTGAYIVTDTVNGGTVVFQAPTTYGTQDRGVYNAGTTYALNDIVRRAVDDEPFISLTNSNTGNALTDTGHWADYAGVNIESVATALAPPGVAALTTGGIAHDANLPPLIDDPVQSPATLDDDNCGFGEDGSRCIGGDRGSSVGAYGYHYYKKHI